MPSDSPSPRRRRAPRYPVPTIGVVLVAGLCGIAGTAATEPEPRDHELERALRVIESAFRSADAEALRAVLPRRSKVLLELESYSRPAAYYAPEQVVLIFGRIFEDVQILRFQFHRNRGSGPGSRLHYVPAVWSGRSGGGMRETRVQFLLVREEATGYRIREIKEVP